VVLLVFSPPEGFVCSFISCVVIFVSVRVCVISCGFVVSVVTDRFVVFLVSLLFCVKFNFFFCVCFIIAVCIVSLVCLLLYLGPSY